MFQVFVVRTAVPKFQNHSGQNELEQNQLEQNHLRENQLGFP